MVLTREIKKRGLVGNHRKPLEFITIREGRKRADIYSMRYKTKLNKLNVVIGGVCVLYGCCTILLPTGSVFAIVGGLSLMLNPISIRLLCSNCYKDIRFFVLTKLRYINVYKPKRYT